MRQRLAMLAVILHVALGSSAYAHHSHFYDECKSIGIEGRVERVDFKNPHNLIVLRLDDGAVYTVDWVNLTRLTSAGIIGAAKEAVVSGARVAVTGYLIRDAVELRRCPEVQGRRESEHCRSTLVTACGRQFQLATASEGIRSELRP